MSIPRTTVEERKALPLASGVLDYFPDALLVVAEVSRVGNEQHHPGAPLHWDKSKSTDEADALMRHLLDRGTLDTDGLRHSGKVAWRALALLQRELDAEELAEKVEMCACHIPSYPVGDEHVAMVQRKYASEYNAQLLVGARTAQLLRDQSYDVQVEEWGHGDGPVFRLRDVADSGL